MRTDTKIQGTMVEDVEADPGMVLEDKAPPPRLQLCGKELVPAQPYDADTWSQSLASVLGVKDAALAAQIIAAALNAVPTEGADKAQLANTIIAAIAELKPCNGLEALLAVQAVVANFTALALLHKGQGSIPPGLAETRLNLAEKYLRLSTQQLRTLGQHRQHGRQEVHVSHVHVHQGAQAIVGAVQTGKTRQTGG